MTEKVTRSSLAIKDIGDLAEYYRVEAGLTVAHQFVNNTEMAVKALASYPQMGATLGLSGSERDIRRWHIEGFPRLLILYRPTEDGITIIRVLDAGRDIADLFPE